MKPPRRSRTRRAPVQTRPAPMQIVASGARSGAARPPLGAMTPDELRAWIGRTRAALERKQARERAYLDRRASRGVHTPTDEAYEADQLLETDLLDMLNEFERVVALMHP